MKVFKVVVYCERVNRSSLIRSYYKIAETEKEAINLAKIDAFLSTSIGIANWKLKFLTEEIK